MLPTNSISPPLSCALINFHIRKLSRVRLARQSWRSNRYGCSYSFWENILDLIYFSFESATRFILWGSRPSSIFVYTSFYFIFYLMTLFPHLTLRGFKCARRPFFPPLLSSRHGLVPHIFYYIYTSSNRNWSHVDGRLPDDSSPTRLSISCTPQLFSNLLNSSFGYFCTMSTGPERFTHHFRKVDTLSLHWVRVTRLIIERFWPPVC